MEFTVYIFPIKQLIRLYEKKRLILDPPYQRNFIWSKSDQEKLIDSILNNFPLPNLFFLVKDDVFEVVDGQQRIRTIINYHKGLLIPKNKEQRKESIEYDSFLEYSLIRAEITRLDEGKDLIEDFYARVNKTGLKLNKPELNKAEYFYTEFLSLNQELASFEKFNILDIFKDTSVRRMNVIDFISELVAFIHFGLYEKKEKVDELYEKDISLEIKNTPKIEFLRILDIIIVLNSISPINRSRYRQRNDFFTLFGFIHNMKNKLMTDHFSYIYNLLILFQEDISPSNDFCPPFREYALNCVSQSNSKNAREKRLQFYYDIFLNTSDESNGDQDQVMEFYDIKEYELFKIDTDSYTIPLELIKRVKNIVD